MKVSIIGVVVGGIVDVVSSLITGLPITLFAVSRLDPSLRAAPHSSGAITAALHANLGLRAVELAVGLMCSVLGGYVSAAIARRHERLNGALSSWLCVGLGVSVIALGISKGPLWQEALLLLASPACAFLGGELRRRQGASRTMQPVA
jgi:fructose-specific phosphotransferase system IIC component